jgi:tetratricopeptide (TPR) repeat protein
LQHLLVLEQLGAECHGLGALLQRLGGPFSNDGAAALFERAVAAREKALGAGHSRVGHSLVGLAGARARRTDLEGALEALQRALRISDHMQGEGFEAVEAGGGGEGRGGDDDGSGGGSRRGGGGGGGGGERRPAAFTGAACFDAALVLERLGRLREAAAMAKRAVAVCSDARWWGQGERGRAVQEAAQEQAEALGGRLRGELEQQRQREQQQQQQ